MFKVNKACKFPKKKKNKKQKTTKRPNKLTNSKQTKTAFHLQYR